MTPRSLHAARAEPASAGHAAPAIAAPALNRPAVLATILGNGLEFYDFMCYATFAVAIGHAFFPAQDPLSSLLLSLATFGVGFVTRPLGAVLIGAYADRRGRRAALTLNILLMALGTAGIAFTPDYATLGPAAPLILVAARLVQGLSLGGEVGPSTSLLLESAPPGWRGRLTSWQGASQGIATLIAGLLALLLGLLLPPAAVTGWGWRIPFALGLLIVPVGVYIRRRLPETLVAPGAGATLPQLGVVWSAHRRALIAGILSVMAASVATYIALYMTTYALTTLHLPPSSAAWGTIAGSLGILAGNLLGGVLGDRQGLRPVMMIPRALTLLLFIPAFRLLVWLPGPATLALVAFTLAFVGGISAAAMLTGVTAAFPRPVRSTGLALTYAVAVTLFGSTTQFVIAWLTGWTGDPVAPAYYGMATAAISLLAMWRLPAPQPE